MAICYYVLTWFVTKVRWLGVSYDISENYKEDVDMVLHGQVSRLSNFRNFGSQTDFYVRIRRLLGEGDNFIIVTNRGHWEVELWKLRKRVREKNYSSVDNRTEIIVYVILVWIKAGNICRMSPANVRIINGVYVTRRV